MRFEIKDTIDLIKKVISSMEKLKKVDWLDMSNERELRNAIDIVHSNSLFLPISYFNWIDWLTLNHC